MNFLFLRVDRIDFIVHGDDPCIVDGKDVYETAQKLGKYIKICILTLFTCWNIDLLALWLQLIDQFSFIFVFRELSHYTPHRRYINYSNSG